VLPDFAQCLAACTARDADFDGVFVVAHRHRFCRPSCSIHISSHTSGHGGSAPQSVDRAPRFFATPAAARNAGLTACKRCLPEWAPRLPDARIEQPLVLRALRLIEQGALQNGGSRAMALRLGTTPKALGECFMAELGAPIADIASDVVLRAGMPLPGGRARGPVQLRLPVRAPFCAEWVFDFLDKRSLPGLEEVVDGVYRRRLSDSDWLAVHFADDRLVIDLPTMSRARQLQLLGRVGVVFDVNADSRAIDRVLKKERWLRPQVTGGIRVPGAWDGFETAVRAILGQQVSVARARNLAIELMRRFGEGGFPQPAQLVEADVSAIGMPGKRGGAVRALAAAVLDGQLELSNVTPAAEQFSALCALPGIGPWTAGYVSMRIAGDANAFPRADWVILKQLGMTAGAAERYSLAWQPYRSYALMYIWQASAQARGLARP